MWDWVRSRPQRCLKFGVDAVAWADTHRNWRGRRRYRCLMSPLAEGMVKPSPADQNLGDLSALQGCIRKLVGEGPDFSLAGHSFIADLPRPIAVLLPDAAVRAVVLHLDRLPTKREERDALIRWRLGQEQLFPLGGARVVSQMFQGVGQVGNGNHTVLAVAIQESVLSQYESLCESVGLIPHEVGMTSLRLFDLWRKASGGAGWTRRDFLWASVSDRALTTMVFHRGRLLFYRCKLLGVDSMSAGAMSDMMEKIVQECEASLDACQQRHPYAAIKEAVICAEGELSALQAQIESSLNLSVERLGWGSMEALGWVTKGSHRDITSLAAMAGVS